MNLRDYQLRCVEQTLATFEQHRSALVVMPTGTGKTVTFAEIVRRMEPRGRAIVHAHREELIWQAAKKIRAVTGHECDVEMADFRADDGKFHRARCIVASVQTLISGERKNRFDPKEFGLIVTDEAHHATAKSYVKVFDHFHQNPDLRHLGVTATPDRADEEALGKVYDEVAFVYEIVDAIRDGWLVPIRQRSVVVNSLDYAKVRTTAGDLNQGDLAEVMEYEENLQKVAGPAMDLAAWRKTLVFATSVAHAERLCEIFDRRRRGCARWVCGETPKPERQEILRDFSRGAFQFLVNVGVLTEGYDEPGVELIVMARPTKSRSLFSQMVGRGTRPLPGLVDDIDDADGRRAAIAASPKPGVEVLDFVGNTGRHKLVTTADILGGNYTPEEVERAEQIIKEGEGAAVDTTDALLRAKADIEAEKLREKNKRKHVLAQVGYEVQTVDAFDVFGIDAPVIRGWDVGHPMTDKQKAIIENAGIKTDGLNKKQASAIINEIFARREDGRCTYKQARVLQRAGVDTTGMTFDEASRQITQLAASRWKAGVA